MKKLLIVLALIATASAARADLFGGSTPPSSSVPTLNVSTLTITNSVGIGTTTPSAALVVGNDSNFVVTSAGNMTMANGSATSETALVFSRIGVCQQGGSNCPSGGTVDMVASGNQLGLYRNGTDPFVYYDSTSGATVINNIFSLDDIRFNYGGVTKAFIDATGGFTENFGVTASSVSAFNASATDTYSLLGSTSSVGPYTVAVSTKNHVNFEDYQSSATVSSCGTQPSFIGNDNVFQVTGGAGATGCTITFKEKWTKVPICNVTPETGSVTNTFSYTVSATAVVVTETGLGTGKIDAHCFGRD